MLADWDHRLISPERALELAGDWPIAIDGGVAQLSQFEGEAGGQLQRDQWQVNLRCQATAHGQPEGGRICDQSVALLARRPDGDSRTAVTATSPAELLSGVLRHMVMAHEVPLNGGSASGR